MREGEVGGIVENETARETETARGDKVRVMCGEGKRGGRLRQRHRRRGGTRKGEATETKCERREGEVMCGEGERGRRRRRRGKQNGEMDGNQTPTRG
ncbi:hypothetical protein ACOSP7_024871 [Xanthoceras sorbifolium]